MSICIEKLTNNSSMEGRLGSITDWHQWLADTDSIDDDTTDAYCMVYYVPSDPKERALH